MEIGDKVVSIDNIFGEDGWIHTELSGVIYYRRDALPRDFSSEWFRKDWYASFGVVIQFFDASGEAYPWLYTGDKWTRLEHPASSIADPKPR